MATIGVLELEEADNFGGDDLQLDVGEVFANAAMATSAEGQVRR